MFRLKGHKGEVCASTGCHGKVATGGHDKTLYFWDPSVKGSTAKQEKTSTMQLIHKFKDAHDHIISCLEYYNGPAFTQALVVSGGWDGSIRIWDFEYRKGKESGTSGTSGTRNSKTGPNPPTPSTASGTDSDCAGRSGLIRTLKGHSHRIKSLSACSNHLAADIPRIASGADDCSIRVWNLRSGECLLELSNIHTGFITGVNMTPSLFCCHKASMLPRWKLSVAVKNSDVGSGPTQNITHNSSVDHPLLASCGADAELIVSSAYDGKKLWRRSKNRDRMPEITYVQFCYDRDRSSTSSDLGGRLLCCGDSCGVIFIFSVIEASRTGTSITLELRHEINEHAGKITGLSMSQTSSAPLLFSVAADNKLLSWNAKTGDPGPIQTTCTASGPGSIQSKISVLSCSTVLAATNSETGESATMRNRASGQITNDEETLDEYIIVTGTNALVIVFTVSTTFRIDKANENADAVTLVLQAPSASADNSSDNLISSSKADAVTTSVDDNTNTNTNTDSENGSESSINLANTNKSFLPNIGIAESINTAGQTENIGTEANSNANMSGKLPLVSGLSSSEQQHTATERSAEGTPSSMTGRSLLYDTTATSAEHDGSKKTLLESLNMDGGPSSYSLGYGVPDKGLAADGSPKSSPGVVKTTAQKIANENENEISKESSDSKGVVSMNTSNATQNTAKREGSRGVLSVGGRNKKIRGSANSTPMTVQSSGQSNSRESHRGGLQMQKRNIRQVESSTPAYCLLDPNKSGHTTKERMESAQHMVDSLSRNSRRIMQHPQQKVHDSSRANPKGLKLMDEVLSSYGGLNANASGHSNSAPTQRRLIESNSAVSIAQLKK